MPCNDREGFNELTISKVQFITHGRLYNIDVMEGPSKTRLNGEGWKLFLFDNYLTSRGQIIAFYMILPQPKMTTIFMNDVGVKEDDEDEDAEMEDDTHFSLQSSPKEAILGTMGKPASTSFYRQSVATSGFLL